jgi:UDPglucose 6-dehydrogenase
MKKSICVIGAGFVGGSLATVFSERDFDVWSYDISGKVAQGARDPRSLMKISDVKDVVNVLEATQKNFSKVYFVCLPTPMYEDGSCDLSIVEGVLKKLSEAGGDRIAVIKSTVPPGSTDKWNKMFEGTGLKAVIHSPEFLREATALNDMRNQDRIILGGPKKYIDRAKTVFMEAFPTVPIYKTSSTNSEACKYFINNFLATKVSFCNEFYEIINALKDQNNLDVDYDRVIELATLDQRIGKSHTSVPGPMPLDDGSGKPSLGWGGSCFAKDSRTISYVAKELGVDPKVIDGAWEKNLQVRPQQDWKFLAGRAVSINKKEK